MQIVHVRCSFLTAYLIALGTYGFFNMIFCLKQGYQSAETRSLFMEKLKSDSKPTKGRMEPIVSVEDFFDRLKVYETNCRKMVEVGGSYCKKTVDHSKMVCLDDDVKLRANSCSVYSFGIGEDMTFDDLIERFGCEVYSFDPTVPLFMVKDNLRKNLQFYPIGLSNKYERTHHKWTWPDGQVQEVRGTVDTLRNIKAKLGHREKIIDYLKIDIDGSEWQVLPDMMKSGELNRTSQIAVEIHALAIRTLPTNQIVDYLQNLWNILLDLRRHGFLRAYYQDTPVIENLFAIPGTNKSIPTCAELLFIKRTSSENPT